MATRETAAADSNVSRQRRCNRATAMALQGRDGETRVASKQIQRGCKREMETRATAIKARQRRPKWAMVQATATVMYQKGSSFYNLIINKDGPRMLVRWRDKDERQFKLPPSSNTVSLRRISFFLEIRSPQSVTLFFFQNTPFPSKSNKTAPAAKPLSACQYYKWFKGVGVIVVVIIVVGMYHKYLLVGQGLYRDPNSMTIKILITPPSNQP